MMKKTAPMKPMMPPKPMPKPPEMDMQKPMTKLGEKLKEAKMEHCMCPEMAENMGQLMMKDPGWLQPAAEKVQEWVTDVQFKLKDTDHSGMISEKEFGIQEGFFKKFNAENAMKQAEFNQKDRNNDGMLSRDEFGGMKAMTHLEGCVPPNMAMPMPPKMDGMESDFEGFGATDLQETFKTMGENLLAEPAIAKGVADGQ
ncbi:MAG: hypothetical protein ACK46X_07420 [Candidatus Sericytochromatia bacterium]